jgi:hypothetical protein
MATTTVTPDRVDRHLELPKTASQSASASLRIPKTADYREQIAKEIVTPLLAGLTLGEVEALIEDATGRKVNQRQIATWKDGKERPQFDALIAVPQFRPRLLLLWAAFIQRLTKCVD